MTWQDKRMTLTPRHRRHTKSSSNSKRPFIADEEIVLLDSTTMLETPDVAAKTTMLDDLLHSTTTNTTATKTPDVAAEMTAK